ncbi:hypothetical protein [Nocardioides caldifontis]|uniref:hypothetical protein n=1 Tax=Nocardioides caldifontis TaxID=2588938 RepID=UPI0011DFFAEF|nr:hypothetical protein [Nocardioides caldifontis]
MSRLRTATALLAAPLLLVALAACGEDEGDGADGASETTESPTGAAASCEEVWGGEKLPDPYEGCTEDGTVVAAVTQECSSGQVIVTYDDRYYAVPGGPVNDVGSLAESKQYHKALRQCTA